FMFFLNLIKTKPVYYSIILVFFYSPIWSQQDLFNNYKNTDYQLNYTKLAEFNNSIKSVETKQSSFTVNKNFHTDSTIYHKFLSTKKNKKKSNLSPSRNLYNSKDLVLFGLTYKTQKKYNFQKNSSTFEQQASVL